MSTVQIPPVLRKITGERTVRADGATLAALLEDLYTRYPDMKDHLQPDGTALSRYVNVYVNDQDVRMTGGLETALSPQDEVIILPAMAGGTGLNPSFVV